jgi:hypothetical protein
VREEVCEEGLAEGVGDCSLHFGDASIFHLKLALFSSPLTYRYRAIEAQAEERY